MKIVFNHFDPLPVTKYGGIERLKFWQMVDLVKMGHQVALIGHPDSKVDEHGIELIPFSSMEKWWKNIPADADLLHMTYNDPPPIDLPVFLSIQGNGKPGEKFPLNTAFISKKHAANHGSRCFVYNGIDLDEYPIQKSERVEKLEDFLFLGKGSWSVKNLKGCIRMAKKLKKHLHIAGGRSLIPSRYIHSHGMVGGQEKIDLINSCDALLFPVRWHEPFGLAVVESMAMGLPVFASSYGSLPELINDDVGRVFSSEEEMLTWLMEPSISFDPLVIRKYVEDNFSIRKANEGYLAIYEKILAGETLNEVEPEWCIQPAATELLSF